MILEDEVFIAVTNRNINYYKNKGYEIPVDRKITVRLEDLPSNSDLKVTKICDECGKHLPNRRYADIITYRTIGDGKDRCNGCGWQKSGKSRKKNVKISLEQWTIENNKEYLLEEFCTINNKKPHEISFGSKDEYWWKCLKCKNLFETSVDSRTSGSNCPYCCIPAKMIKVGFNDLWTTHPEIAKLLVDKSKGFQLSAGSNGKEEFKCVNCNLVEEKTLLNIVNRGFSCSRCSDGLSYPEKIMASVLDQLNINFKTQKIFNWSKGINHENNKLKGDKKYDFYIPNLNMIIETHGVQHYEGGFERYGGRNLEEEQENDKLKKKLASENGIENYIVIDCRKSELEFIKNKIINSVLSILIDLNKIDWLSANEIACNSLVKKTCELWNSYEKSTFKIAKQLNVSYGTVIRYLKQGGKLGWCEYNTDNTIVQLTVNGEYIREYANANEAAKILKIQQPSISRVCNGKMKSTGGYKWMFKNDYDKLDMFKDGR
ncbi:zinc-ribbon domain-containing protein [Bacillus xiapuensis]|uniref:Zinc-ribbon domain-containing protein n=1 Tax=Bacillus xiapuensis TaxID=2014075 RepID=A0ABU6N810_9BACI|nr:zinc-ribbon domain-containing protein [Bacillus xiapuensis]